MSYVIETNNLTKRYSKKEVVKDVSMHVEKGTIYGFVGENGSGKTTIMRMLTGLAEPSGGSYSLFGVGNKDKGIYECRRHISALVETASLVPSFNALDNIIYQEIYLGIKLTKEERMALLEKVHLENTGKKKVKNFSLGMRQRLAIALALINKPQLMILDEPMNGLDPEAIAELRALLVELNQNEGITILISSHILSELEKIATFYGFICKGHLLEELTSDELIQKCQKSLLIKVDDFEAGLELIKKKYSNVETHLQKEIVIYDDVDINELVKYLDKNHIKILSMKSNENSVEDYYLNLIKEVRIDG